MITHDKESTVSELKSYSSLQVVTHFMTMIPSSLTSVLTSTSLAIHIHSNILKYKVGVLCYAQNNINGLSSRQWHLPWFDKTLMVPNIFYHLLPDIVGCI